MQEGMTIKPDAIWRLFEKCGDSKWLGDICRKIGGQDVELDFGQKQVFEILIAECAIFHNFLAAKREKDRKRQEEWRKKHLSRSVTVTNGDLGWMDDNHSSIPSIPSIPSKEGVGVRVIGEGDDGAQARSPSLPKIPSLGDVLQFAADAATKPSGVAIPEAFAREWHALMQSGGWLNARGRTVLTNWRQALIYAYRREVQFAKERGNRRDGGGTQPEGQIYHEEGYENPL